MAFEQPLEADRVDDLNFFTAFVRAPVIGPILWLLGGEKAKKAQEEADRKEILSGEPHHSHGRKLKSALKKRPPNLTGSDLSECTAALEDLDVFQSASGCVASDHGLRNKKRLSWSDESGGTLKQVIGGESVRFESKRFGPEQPNRTTMTRTRSVTSHLEGPEKNFLPRGLERPPEGPSYYPSNPYRVERSTSNDLESPLWGWYVRTTPPSPEMFCSRPPKKNASSGDTSTASTASNSTDDTAASSQPPLPLHGNPVFRGMQSKNKDAPLGFPSVPL